MRIQLLLISQVPKRLLAVQFGYGLRIGKDKMFLVSHSSVLSESERFMICIVGTRWTFSLQIITGLEREIAFCCHEN